MLFRSPPPPEPRQSNRLQGIEAEIHTTFLSEYATVRDTHNLFPTDIIHTNNALSIDEFLSALSDGTIEPTPNEDNDKPTWAQAMSSNECEYWIAGGRDELKSLTDLKVFVLVPRSDLPHSQHPLKGKLVCKRKHDDTGKIVQYKVQYVAKGFAQ